ncbi:hypothetical protein FA95DRAFT_1555530 [Auriscalpium vulgare]|uniref:Uncharacterized protein n=1 Tax=Auriscalpium vulgare TaxID=40419 RepID=A0ACB8S2U5_9AGAM|nr:hypothetical protein FA95DRAFT_1555530 [Auriscalpium vulgare]
MSNAQLPEDQLIELLLQLKKTTPDQAKGILNQQPQISYALIALMVKMNAVNVEVLEKTLTGGAGPQLNGTAQATGPPPAAPVSAVPPRMQTQSSRTGTPQYPTPPPAAPYAQTQPVAAPSSYPGFANTPPGPASYHNQAPSYPPQQPAQPSAPALPTALPGISEEQKAMIMHVISMTPEQINRLPPAERASLIQLRATLGIP